MLATTPPVHAQPVPPIVRSYAGHVLLKGGEALTVRGNRVVVARYNPRDLNQDFNAMRIGGGREVFYWAPGGRSTGEYLDASPTSARLVYGHPGATTFTPAPVRGGYTVLVASHGKVLTASGSRVLLAGSGRHVSADQEWLVI